MDQSSKPNICERILENAGGWSSILKHWTLSSSIVLVLVFFPYWIYDGWWTEVIDILSILLGFSISGFSVAIAYISNSFLGERLMRRHLDGTQSIYVRFNAMFAIYMATGFVALLSAIFCRAWFRPELYEQPAEHVVQIEWFWWIISRSMWGIAWFFFVFCLMCGMSVIIEIYRLSEMTQAVHDSEIKRKANATRKAHGSPNKEGEK